MGCTHCVHPEHGRGKPPALRVPGCPFCLAPAEWPHLTPVQGWWRSCSDASYCPAFLTSPRGVQASPELSGSLSVPGATHQHMWLSPLRGSQGHPPCCVSLGRLCLPILEKFVRGQCVWVPMPALGKVGISKGNRPTLWQNSEALPRS